MKRCPAIHTKDMRRETIKALMLVLRDEVWGMNREVDRLYKLAMRDDSDRFPIMLSQQVRKVSQVTWNEFLKLEKAYPDITITQQEQLEFCKKRKEAEECLLAST